MSFALSASTVLAFACDVCKERTDGCCLSLSAVVVVLLFVVVVH